jgi:hypothetical protein
MLYKLFSHSVKQNPPSEADSSTATQKINRILRNSILHNRVHKCPPDVSTLSQISPIYALQFSFFKIQFNMTLPFPTKFLYPFLPHAKRHTPLIRPDCLPT